MAILDLILLVLSQIFYGLAARPHGRYADASGTTTIDYGWQKVLVTLPKRFAPFTCKVRFEKVILQTCDGELAFTYDSKADAFEGPDALRLVKVTCQPDGPLDSAPHSAR